MALQASGESKASLGPGLVVGNQEHLEKGAGLAHWDKRASLEILDPGDQMDSKAHEERWVMMDEMELAAQVLKAERENVALLATQDPRVDLVTVVVLEAPALKETEAVEETLEILAHLVRKERLDTPDHLDLKVIKDHPSVNVLSCRTSKINALAAMVPRSALSSQPSWPSLLTPPQVSGGMSSTG